MKTIKEIAYEKVEGFSYSDTKSHKSAAITTFNILDQLDELIEYSDDTKLIRDILDMQINIRIIQTKIEQKYEQDRFEALSPEMQRLEVETIDIGDHT